MKILFLSTWISVTSYASINGRFYSEFKRNNMDCAIEATLSQKRANQITFKQWDELCEDNNGNTFESSLADITTYEKIGVNKLSVTQGNEKIELDAKVLEFNKDFVHYNFELDTEDGHLEIDESYQLKGNDLNFSSIFILDGKKIINKAGTIAKTRK